MRKLTGLAALVLSLASCRGEETLSPLTYCQRIAMGEQQGDRPMQDICNGFDDDCDGQVDEQCDRDKDGYCDPNALFQNCAVVDPSLGCVDDMVYIYYFRADDQRLKDYCPGTFSGCGQHTCAPVYDCNDFEASINPGALELCDNLDNNCDGVYNDDFPEKGELCYEFGEAVAGVGSCFYGVKECLTDSLGNGTYSGRINCAGDVAPIEEICDAADNDCDGEADEDTTPQTCYYELYYDADGNSYTVEATQEQREKMDGLVSMCRPGVQMCVEYCSPREIDEGTCTLGTYSDDCYGAFIPRDVDECNCMDEDCNGTIDDLFNTDGDNYSTCACPVADCDDTNGSIYPGAPAICNDGIDQNCDGQDELGQDNDNDSYIGGPECNEGDCDDSNASIHPEAQEICNCFDDDCDGEIDEGNNLTSYDHLFITDCSGSMDDVIQGILDGYANAPVPGCYSQTDYIKMSTAYVSELVLSDQIAGEPVLVNALISPNQFQQNFQGSFPVACGAYETSLDAIAYAACARIWSRGEDNEHCVDIASQVQEFLSEDGQERTLWRPYSQAFIHYLGDEWAQTQYGMTPSKVKELVLQADITLDLYILPLHQGSSPNIVTDQGPVRLYSYGHLVTDENGVCNGYVHNLDTAVVDGTLVTDFTATIIDSYCSEDNLAYDCEIE